MLRRILGNNIRRAVPTWRYKPFAPTLARFNSNKSATIKVDPQMMIAFTCKKCDNRSSHTFSKQAYTKGTVAIQCPGCLNRHLIADNLKIFDDKNFNLQEYLKNRGENVGTGVDDLVFEDIPESLKSTLGHHAKDAPKEYHEEESRDNSLPSGEKKEK